MSVFKTHLKNIRPKKRAIFNIRDKHGLSLLTRLRVDFSDLRDHRFRHKWNCSNPICKCKNENETTDHYLLRCPIFNEERENLFSALSDILKIDKVLISSVPSVTLVDMLLYGSQQYNVITDRRIIEVSTHFILMSRRFKKIEAYQDQDGT